MTDRAGLFAALADSLTGMCGYYVVAGLLIMANRGWGVHILWLLLCTAACQLAYALILKKPRSTGLLTAVTAALFLASMAVLLLASTTPPGFGYVLVLAVGGGMAAGLPLYYTLHRPRVLSHLKQLDALILVLGALLLLREAVGVDGAAVALVTVVLLMDAACAVGLRMSDGSGGDGGAFRASMIALAASSGLALVIGLVTAIFSRGAAFADGVLRGVRSFFAAVGGAIEGFFVWLTSKIGVEETYAPIELQGELPSVAGAETVDGSGFSLPFSETAAGVILCALVLAAVVAVVLVLRKKRFRREAETVSVPDSAAVRRSGGTAAALWRRLLDELRFRRAAFRNRDTAGGLLVRLERLARRARVPRREGESMRAFVRRMDDDGGLDELCDALDRACYADMSDGLTPSRCRALRRRMRKAVRRIRTTGRGRAA